VAHVELARDGRFLFFVTHDRRIHKFDVAARREVASLVLPVAGPFAISPNGESIYLVDGSWTRELPGSGRMVRVLGSLASYDEIDLQDAAYGGTAPALNGVTVSHDGRTVYVGAGTPSRGPIFGVQKGKILVVDAVAKQLTQVMDLDAAGVRTILPLP
jgi:hypothetical protein